jgi:hypothetical protein
VARVYATVAPFGFILLILLLTTGVLGRLLSPVQGLIIQVVFGGIGL